MAISFDTLPKIKQLEPKLVPPRGAKAVGVHEMPGDADKIIYEQRVFDPDATKASKTPATDAEGNEMWRKHQTTGEKLVQVMTIEPKFRTRRFILRAFGNGKVKCIENFEETEGERAERELRQRRDQWMDEFRDLAIDEGVSPRDAIRMFLEGQSSEGEEITVDDAAIDEAVASYDEESGVMTPRLPFDPSAYTVAELRSMISERDLSLEDKTLLREAESTGKNRNTVLDALE